MMNSSMMTHVGNDSMNTWGRKRTSIQRFRQSGIQAPRYPIEPPIRHQPRLLEYFLFETFMHPTTAQGGHGCSLDARVPLHISLISLPKNCMLPLRTEWPSQCTWISSPPKICPTHITPLGTVHMPHSIQSKLSTTWVPPRAVNND